MKRELTRLSDGDFDLCVVGGGIYGACVAWDATLRGLTVALVDKGDFGHATSSNSQKVVHGGFRYIKNGDIARMRESIRERAAWMRIAPHLVHPLPILIPTYRDVKKAKQLVSMALAAYNLISLSVRNGLEDPQKHIPRGRMISRKECLELLSGMNAGDVTGAAIFYDAQMYNSERLLLSIVRSAARAGAVVANYVGATGFLVGGNRVNGVKARDTLTGDEFDIRAKVVVNTVGPWVNQLMRRLEVRSPTRPIALCKAFNLVVREPLSKCAVGLYGGGSRLFFATPWHNRTIVGTAQLPFGSDVDDSSIHENEIEGFVKEVNSARPGLSLRREDIVFLHRGVVPADENSVARGDVQLATRCRILDHQKESGLDGLISAVGVKYTTARSVAESVVDLAFKKLGYGPPMSRSAETPIHGGSVTRFDAFLGQAITQRSDGLCAEDMRHLAYNYGSAYPEVLKYANHRREGAENPSDHSQLLKAEVVHGIREEMAQKLTDVVFRRTELGSAGNPGSGSLATCASIMAEEMGWDQIRTSRELDEVKAAFLPGDVHA